MIKKHACRKITMYVCDWMIEGDRCDYRDKQGEVWCAHYDSGRCMCTELLKDIAKEEKCQLK